MYRLQNKSQFICSFLVKLMDNVLNSAYLFRIELLNCMKEKKHYFKKCFGLIIFNASLKYSLLKATNT